MAGPVRLPGEELMLSVAFVTGVASVFFSILLRNLDGPFFLPVD